MPAQVWEPISCDPCIVFGVAPATSKDLTVRDLREWRLWAGTEYEVHGRELGRIGQLTLSGTVEGCRLFGQARDGSDVEYEMLVRDAAQQLRHLICLGNTPVQARPVERPKRPETQGG